MTRIKARREQIWYNVVMSQKTLLETDRAQALKLADCVQVAPASIVSRTLVQSPEARVVLFCFAEGQELSAHCSPRRAFVQILAGACSFLFDGRWQRLETGMFLHLPPGHPHAVKADDGPFSMLLTLGAELPGPSAPEKGR